MQATDPAVVTRNRLPLSLLAIRWTMVVFLLPWVADKFVRPEHAIAVLEGFYGLSGSGAPLVFGLGVAQAVLLALFAFGVARTWSYGLVLAMHAVTTLVSWKQYLDPYTGANLLFFAAWPALGACLALFLLREHDTLGTVGRR
ncbi:hypothetical protein [Luteimonas vadosa]|uniref:DoxX family membrane protein n=1 Tax=Luteimonas vadosa TaxID=1165507 RepID=A0ABP9DMM8_9GAMM